MLMSMRFGVLNVINSGQLSGAYKKFRRDRLAIIISVTILQLVIKHNMCTRILTIRLRKYNTCDLRTIIQYNPILINTNRFINL